MPRQTRPGERIGYNGPVLQDAFRKLDSAKGLDAKATFTEAEIKQLWLYWKMEPYRNKCRRKHTTD